jgi:hypothetical protein
MVSLIALRTSLDAEHKGNEARFVNGFSSLPFIMLTGIHVQYESLSRLSGHRANPMGWL